MKETFWLVWNPEGRAPMFRHPTFESAKAEAARLAMKQPGHFFHVLENCGHAASNAVIWTSKRGNERAFANGVPF